MRDRCIAAVSEAMGRKITVSEARGIEANIINSMRALARRDPEGWHALPDSDRLALAAKMAGQDLMAQAARKKENMHRSIVAFDRISGFVEEMRGKGMSGFDALRRTLVFVPDGKSNTISFESTHNARKAEYLSDLLPALESTSGRFWGWFESAEETRALTKAIHGENVGNPEMARAAGIWRETTDRLKETFNKLGGKIGTLEDWSLPHHHSPSKMLKAGADQWVSDISPLLNRDKYINADGTRMTESQIGAFLRNAYETIVTDGDNKLGDVPMVGGSMLANRHAEARSIHFRDADAYIGYQAIYGERSLYDIMTNHIDLMAKDIALLETYGPNPQATFAALLTRERVYAAKNDTANAERNQKNARQLETLFNFAVNGATMHDPRVAQVFDTLRNWMVASKLGSAAISAIGDEATLHLTAHVNNLPDLQLVKNELAALNPANTAERALANRAGLGLESLISNLNRWGLDNLGSNWSSKMASSVIRASGLTALDGARRRAFGVTYMSALGEISRKYERLADINPDDNHMLLSKGITETDFAIWKAADLEDFGRGNQVLTPASIMRIPKEKMEPIIQAERTRLEAERDQKITDIQTTDPATLEPGAKLDSIAEWQAIYQERIDDLPRAIRADAVKRLLGATLEETNMAVIKPGTMDRYRIDIGKRGTVWGELTRSIFLFKSFPFAMISRHFMRGWSAETVGGKAAYLGSMIAATTVLGAVVQMVDDTINGRDVRNYNPAQGEHGVKNWAAALLRGGSLGLYGDFLFSDVTRSGTSRLAAMLGPVAGLAEGVTDLTLGSLIKTQMDKKVDFGGNAVRLVKGNLPGANLWYTKAALDHFVVQKLQEYFSPGYNQRTQERLRRDYGNEYYWPMGQSMPSRPPDFSRALGANR